MAKTNKKTAPVADLTIADAIIEAVVTEGPVADLTIVAEPIVAEVVAEVVAVIEDDKVAQLRALLTDPELPVTDVLIELNFIPAIKHKAPSKAALSRAILDVEFALTPVKPRKELIALLVAGAGLTDSGAATYLQQYRDRKGFVNHK
jgi:hypothetical protein